MWMHRRRSDRPPPHQLGVLALTSFPCLQPPTVCCKRAFPLRRRRATASCGASRGSPAAEREDPVFPKYVLRTGSYIQSLRGPASPSLDLACVWEAGSTPEFVLFYAYSCMNFLNLRGSMSPIFAKGFRFGTPEFVIRYYARPTRRRKSLRSLLKFFSAMPPPPPPPASSPFPTNGDKEPVRLRRRRRARLLMLRPRRLPRRTTSCRSDLPLYF